MTSSITGHRSALVDGEKGGLEQTTGIDASQLCFEALLTFVAKAYRKPQCLPARRDDPARPLGDLPRSRVFWSSNGGRALVEEALSEMEKGPSLRESARRFEIPITTLHNYSSGKVKVGEQSGPKRYLSEQEEETLSEFIIGCSEIGFPRTRREVF